MFLSGFKLVLSIIYHDDLFFDFVKHSYNEVQLIYFLDEKYIGIKIF